MRMAGGVRCQCGLAVTPATFRVAWSLLVSVWQVCGGTRGGGGSLVQATMPVCHTPHPSLRILPLSPVACLSALGPSSAPTGASPSAPFVTTPCMLWLLFLVNLTATGVPAWIRGFKRVSQLGARRSDAPAGISRKSCLRSLL